MRIFVADARAFADTNLRFNNVDAGDFFRDGVLDLNARIDLDEIKCVGIGVHQKFYRARMGVIRRASQLQRRFTQRSALHIIQIGRRCTLDNFLITSLHGAIALI